MFVIWKYELIKIRTNGNRIKMIFLSLSPTLSARYRSLCLPPSTEYILKNLHNLRLLVRAETRSTSMWIAPIDICRCVLWCAHEWYEPKEIFSSQICYRCSPPWLMNIVFCVYTNKRQQNTTKRFSFFILLHSAVWTARLLAVDTNASDIGLTHRNVYRISITVDMQKRHFVILFVMHWRPVTFSLINSPPIMQSSDTRSQAGKLFHRHKPSIAGDTSSTSSAHVKYQLKVLSCSRLFVSLVKY